MELFQKNIGKGMVAGLIASIVLAVLLLIKSAMGLMPQLDPISMMSRMMGQPDNPAVGWVAHFVIGTILWGGVFGLCVNVFRGALWARGVELGVVAWLLMMIVVMPMAGAGLFGANMGVMPAVVTLVLHLIFGAVLGYSYDKLIHHAHIDQPDRTRLA